MTVMERDNKNIPTLPAEESPSPDKGTIKWVTCIIRTEKLDPIKDQLNVLNLVGGMTVTDVHGFGRQRGFTEHYRGGEYTLRFIPKVRIELAVLAEDVPKIMDVLFREARTGEVGDGKIFVSDVRSAMRIRTGEKGASAL